jgi:hypothetical protein
MTHVVAQPGRLGSIRSLDLGRLGPAAHWFGHLIEMVLVMLIGMQVLFGEFAAVANALGYRDPLLRLPELSTAAMALTMAIPMALWMDYRGHHGRGIVEMSGAMILPAVAVLVAGSLGIVGRQDLPGTYHTWMYVAMLGLMVVRRRDYASGMAHG